VTCVVTDPPRTEQTAAFRLQFGTRSLSSWSAVLARHLVQADDVAAGVVEDGRGDAPVISGHDRNTTPRSRARAQSAWM
jgi:hypothetical protein